MKKFLLLTSTIALFVVGALVLSSWASESKADAHSHSHEGYTCDMCDAHPHSQYTCDRCNGYGRDPYSKCRACNGQGTVKVCERCDNCKGRGTYEDQYGKQVKCFVCSGRGEIYQTINCSACRATGYNICSKCGGTGTVRKN